jgi:mannose-6-phosphate isomerase-like protein (cupin superfamily)
MARAGQEVENPVTGERIVFLRTAADTDGAAVEMEAIWPAGPRRTTPHVHPEAEERWEVLAGRARFRIGDSETEGGPGTVAVAAEGTPHEAWNPGSTQTRVRIELWPALRWEEFVERLFAGESPADLMREFSREVRLAPPRG